MKKTTLSLIRFTAIAILAFSIFSCGEEEVPAPTVQVFSSVDGYQVAFTATATNTDTYSWAFGDGETSTEQNPVHVYAQSGDYTATVTVTGEGGTADATVDVTIAASELEMLTGGPAMANGKTWVFSPSAGEGDGLFKTPPDWEPDISVVIIDGVIGLMGFLVMAVDWKRKNIYRRLIRTKAYKNLKTNPLIDMISGYLPASGRLHFTFLYRVAESI